jgi:hypothetical protein
VDLETTRLQADEDVMSCEFGDGLALLDLRSGKYFSINAVGAFVWSQLSAPATGAQLCQAMLARYDTDEARCLEDLRAWLESMTKAKLIKASHAASA